MGLRERLTGFSVIGAATRSLGTGQKWASIGMHWRSMGSAFSTSAASTGRQVQTQPTDKDMNLLWPNMQYAKRTKSVLISSTPTSDPRFISEMRKRITRE